MTRRHDIDDTELHAFVDGHLAPERRRAVISFVAGDADEAERLAHYRNLNESLHAVYDEVLHEPLPERLKVERYVGRASWRERWRGWLAWQGPLTPRLAAAVLLMLVSGGGGWVLHSHYQAVEAETPAMSFARQAANAHLLYASDLRHPVEFGADQQDNLLLWLSERLGQSVHAPNLQHVGFALVGGRLLPAAGQPAAQLMYENADTKRITLYIRGRWAASPAISAAQEGTVSYTAQGEVGMVYWIEGPLAYALIGPMDREELFAAAKTIQQELHVPPALPATPTADQTADKDAT